MTGRTASGVVLAGGQSSRFGGSKLDAMLSGRTVLDRTIDAVLEACAEVLVVGATSGDRADVRYLADAAPHEGPLAGLTAGLHVADGEILLVVGGDMPLASPAVLRLLIGGLDRPGAAAVLHDGVQQRPLPMAVRRDQARVAAASAIAAGERSLRALLARLGAVAVPMAAWRALDPDGDTLLDIDTPADLERARARLANRAT